MGLQEYKSQICGVDPQAGDPGKGCGWSQGHLWAELPLAQGSQAQAFRRGEQSASLQVHPSEVNLTQEALLQKHPGQCLIKYPGTKAQPSQHIKAAINLKGPLLCLIFAHGQLLWTSFLLSVNGVVPMKLSGESTSFSPTARHAPQWWGGRRLLQTALPGVSVLWMSCRVWSLCPHVA